MAALYDNLTEEHIEHLIEYARLVVKKSVSTTGVVSIDENGIRSITDSNASFIDDGIEENDTIEVIQTYPASAVPAFGSYLITEVVDNNTIEIDGDIRQTGSSIAYRVINTSLLQERINSIHSRIANIQNVQLVEARFQENINTPWYDDVTNIVFYYFDEQENLDDAEFNFRVLQSDLDDITAVPSPLLASPGPLLYPYGYAGSLPDRRLGAAPGDGTPNLRGIPDVPGSGGAPGELDGLQDESFIYSTFGFPPYGLPATQTALDAAQAQQVTALTNEINALTPLVAALTDQITNLQTRGLTGSLFYAKISVGLVNAQAALSNATYALNDPTEGLDGGGSPPQNATRQNFVDNTRIPQVNARIMQVVVDQEEWINHRYVFLNRRINRSGGSLTDTRSQSATLIDLREQAAVLTEERRLINAIIGGSSE